MALNLASISSSLMPNSAYKIGQLARSNPMHYTASGAAGILGGEIGDDSDGLSSIGGSAADLAASKIGSAARVAAKGGEVKGSSFESALLKAMDGVSATQNKSDDLLQRVVADPDSVDAQDVTIAMAEANMSLNLAKTILSRIVTAWKDVINTR
jgi:flagellar hook-basal body complex protein FliE